MRYAIALTEDEDADRVTYQLIGREGADLKECLEMYEDIGDTEPDLKPILLEKNGPGKDDWISVLPQPGLSLDQLARL